MIRTLRITSILAVALAAVLVVFSVVFGVRGDEGVEKLLEEPGVIEKFNKSAGNRSTRGTSQVSPLVQQGKSFALYLNPPKPKTPRSVPNRVTGAKRPPTAKAKFTVLATSYSKDHPEMSIALIDEPGKGLSWFRPSSKVGHLLIEEIKDGAVVFKDSSGSFEIAVEQKPHVSLLEGAPAAKSDVKPIPGSAAKRTSSRPSATTPARSSVYSGRSVSSTAKLSKPSSPRKTTEKDSAMAELTAKLAELQRSFRSNKAGEGPTAQEKAEMYDKIISEFKASRASRLTAEETERLSILGRELKKMMEKPTGSDQK
jgi:hypothetical protein